MYCFITLEQEDSQTSYDPKIILTCENNWTGK
jgi:hypothetical protein